MAEEPGGTRKMAKEESIFDEAVVNEMEEQQMSEDDGNEETLEQWKPKVAKESPKERLEKFGVKAKKDGEVLTIKEVFFTRPRMLNRDGTKIPPKKTQDEKFEYYPGKLGIKFVEGNIVEYYPNFHYFVDENGKVNDFAKINREGNNAVTGIYKLVVAKLGKPEEEIADQDIYDYLVDKKVKIKSTEGTYLGKRWFRNDIVEFI